jgi:hypothetical protein
MDSLSVFVSPSQADGEFAPAVALMPMPEKFTFTAGYSLVKSSCFTQPNDPKVFVSKTYILPIAF